jgi:hypothetical protein
MHGVVHSARHPLRGIVTGMAHGERNIAKESSASGIQRAWDALAERDPSDVARGADISLQGGKYRVRSLGMDYEIDPGSREIRALSTGADVLKRRLSHFFEITWLWYLVRSQDFGLTGRQLKPEQLKGGHHFFKGAHELPLKALAEKFGSDAEAFLATGRELGGKVLSFGDASVEIFPVPRVPVDLILWRGDDEFPARADLLLDSSCELQLPLDIIWSAAVMSVKAMLP